MRRFLLFVLAVSLAVAIIGQRPHSAHGQEVQLPTFPPSPTPSGPTPTPPGPPDKLEGVWEVQMQRGSSTTYSHFKFSTGPGGVSGLWRMSDGKIVPISGTYDGHNFNLTAMLPNQQKVSFSGYVDSPTDMVGLADFGKENVPFTAAHRAKTNLFESVGPGLPGT